jgi:hypothetical protein
MLQKTSPFNTVIDFSSWIDLAAQSKSKVKNDELRISLKLIPNTKSQKMTMSIGSDVLNLLKADKKDSLAVLQDPSNPKHFLIVKAATGFKITFPTNAYGRLMFNIKNSPIKDFHARAIEYSIHPNNIITFYLA